MAWSFLLAVLLHLLPHVQAKAVFAHFMVENAASWTQPQWENDIKLAQAAHIDAFAMNVRMGDPKAGQSLDAAFAAAQSTGFKLFLSFDYAGGGPWPRDEVVSYITHYGSSPQYYRYNGKPFVSTFEGPENAVDWISIKAQTGCFFMPDWSSRGAKDALHLAPGVPDGLFSWAGWPWGNTDMNTYVDASYLQFLNETSPDLKYMMPVSPWFFTNLPGYNKNWLWRGDDLWYDRWQQVWFVQPEFVEIITWNDYGESHYIGPLHDEGMDAFTIGKAPFNFATKMPHDGWRATLPFVIDTYKNGKATVTQEVLTAWYRLTPKAACANDGGTTGNTASQLQVEFGPREIAQDRIFYSALLASSQGVTVTVGGVNLGATWTHVPDGGIGMYHGSVEFGANTGPVVVTVGSMVMTGESIRTSCDYVTGQNGVTNWNAWVGQASGRTVNASPALDLKDQVCIEGTGVGNYAGLCSFACRYGYCPLGACTCIRMGKQVPLPTKETTPGWGTVGYPAEGLDATYSGLCGFNCFYGYCPVGACGTTKYPLNVPTVSPFLPNACTGGSGEGNLAGLCSYACGYGFCPIHSCACTSQGPLNQPPPANGGSGNAVSGVNASLYDVLCDFTCSRGYCPSGACNPTGTSSTGSFIVPVDPSIWDGTNHPIIPCYPPCVLVIPPWPLSEPTTISLPPITTEIESVQPLGTTVTTYLEGYVSTFTVYNTTVITTTIQLPPLMTNRIEWWNVKITTTDTTEANITLTASFLPPPIIISDPENPNMTRTIHPPPWPTRPPASVTSHSGGPPAVISWTSNKPKPTCKANCGRRCVGLYCDAKCIVCPNPDPDWWDPIDPFSPWPNNDPYEPEPDECTTTSAEKCSTGYVVSSGHTNTISSCSMTYGCSAEPSSTVVGTHTLAPWGTFRHEKYPTPDPGEAFSSSVYASVDSVISSIWSSYFATASAPTPTSTSGPPAPGGPCSANGDCSSVSCPPGTLPGCMYHGVGVSTCVCQDNPNVPLGGACTTNEQCQSNQCTSGSHPRCLYHGVGVSTCVCSDD